MNGWKLKTFFDEKIVELNCEKVELSSYNFLLMNGSMNGSKSDIYIMINI